MGKYQKLLCIMLAVIMLISVSACDNGNKSADTDKAKETVIEGDSEMKETDTLNEVTDDKNESVPADTVEDSEKDSDTAIEENDSKSEETSKKEEESTDAATEAETEDPNAVKNITAVSPEVGAVVVLANDDIYSWWKDYVWKKNDSEAYYTHEDQYYPNSVTLQWEVAEAADYYRVSISKNANMSDSDNYVVNACSVELKSLFVATDYYWQVDAVYSDKTLRSAVYSFATAESPRCIEIEGVSNTRDIGGIEYSNGYRIKQGMIYRGGKLETITPEGLDFFVNELGLRTDLDLRTPGEGGAGSVSPLGADINYVNIDGRYYTGSKGITTEEGKALFAQEIRLFTNPDNYPIYIHCSLGRDRTGTLAFVLEALCGANINQLIMDYELSVFSVTGTLDNASVTAIKNNIKATYDYIATFEGAGLAGKTENYLLSIGITAEEIRAIKDILLEEVK